MKVALRDIIDTVTPLIAKSIPSLRLLKTYLRRYFRELEPHIDIAGSFDDVMDIVEKKCTIINICDLEAVVECYNIEEAKCYITDYKSTVDKFCEEVKLSMCENINFMTDSSCLLKCETIEFVLEWEPNKYSLGQIRDLLITSFRDMASKVQVSVIKKGNSIIVTCYAPRHIMDVLLMEAKKNLDLLKGIGVMKLTIGYHIIWDINTKDKVRDKYSISSYRCIGIGYKSS